MGRHAAVATNHPQATQAGIDVLRLGGNAADAAVAISLILGVVEPQMSGLGGDGFYHHHDAQSQRGCVHNGSGHPPRNVQASSFSGTGMPMSGAASVSVPGAIGALFQMHQRHGSLPWKSLCQPAIQAAQEGVGVTFTLHRFCRNYLGKLSAHADSAALFLRQGQPTPIGSYITQPGLARTLGALAEGGAESFYRGELALQLVRDFTRAGIPMDAEDLARFEPEEQTPLVIDYRGFQVHQTPPNSMGFTLLQELRILECFDIAAMGHLSADAIHLMVEAKKRAFLDRERFASDPACSAIPLERLLSREHARELASTIRMGHATDIALNPALTPSGHDTTYFCVVDAKGNAVSGIQSLNNAFGSGITLGSTGVVMNNRMTCWHLDARHPNALRPGKRVRHTMNAPMVLKEGRVWALFGTPGADDQVQVNLQMAVGLVDFDLDPQSLAEAPRWSSDQVGQEANWPHGGKNALTVEGSMPPSIRDTLRDRGHQLIEVPPLEGPCSVALLRALDEGGYAAGSDPRRDGWAAAY